MKQLVIHGVVVGILCAGATTTWAASTNEKFIWQAIECNLSDEKIAQLAQQKAASNEVRSFAAKLHQQYETANDAAVNAAHRLGAEVPNQPNEEDQAVYERLNKLSGEDFDKEFVKIMSVEQQREVDKYTAEQKYSSGVVAAYAASTLPQLQAQLQQMQSLEKAG